VSERKKKAAFLFLILPVDKHIQKGMHSPQNLALRTGISASGYSKEKEMGEG